MKTKRRSIRASSSDSIPADARADIRRKLLRWYDRNKRDLPWRRRNDDPYAQWVAEIMLQQTRVETVLGYYERFMARFPTIDALAIAHHEEVLKYWEGLGYYRRILFFHRAAKVIHERDGVIPSTIEQLKELPGIGEYTAAAIASIAFNVRAAAVDGNVERVLARLFGMSENTRSPGGKSRIRSFARQLLSASRPGDFNQAWMDLGSGVCLPSAPTCVTCPLGTVCIANRENTTSVLPNRGGRARRPVIVSLVTGVFVWRRKLYAKRRETGGLWSGLWEFPSAEVGGEASLGRALRRLAGREHLKVLGKPTLAGSIRHELTHRSLTFHTFVAAVEPTSVEIPKNEQRQWVSRRGFGEMAVSTAHRKVFAACEGFL